MIDTAKYCRWLASATEVDNHDHGLDLYPEFETVIEFGDGAMIAINDETYPCRAYYVVSDGLDDEFDTFAKAAAALWDDHSSMSLHFWMKDKT